MNKRTRKPLRHRERVQRLLKRVDAAGVGGPTVNRAQLDRDQREQRAVHQQLRQMLRRQQQIRRMAYALERGQVTMTARLVVLAQRTLEAHGFTWERAKRANASDLAVAADKS